MKVYEKKITHMRKKLLIDSQKLEILSLYAQDYKLNLHGRAISKKLGINQKNISNHLRKLADMHILKYKILGKNKSYYLNNYETTKLFLVIAETYKTIKLFSSNFEVQDLISNIIDYLEGIVLVFGSFSKWYAIKGSDLDILVIGKIRNKAELEKMAIKYTTKIHLIKISKKEFESGLRKNKAFMLEVLRGHIIVAGYDEFVKLVWGVFNE